MPSNKNVTGRNKNKERRCCKLFGAIIGNSSLAYFVV